MAKLGFVDSVIAGLERLSTTRYNSVTDMAAKTGMAQAVVWKLINRKAHPRADVLGRMLDAIGARLVFPDEERVKDVVFASVPAGPGQSKAGDFRGLAVYPLSDAILVSPSSWTLIHSADPSLVGRPNLIAVAVPQGDIGMAPTFAAGDVLLVDPDDRQPFKGQRPVHVVRDPEGGCLLRRVSMEERKGEPWLVYYGDSPTCVPSMYPLAELGGLQRAVVGRVVRGWLDVPVR